ncbi:alpha/beta hydrolase [Vibrio sp. SCSIO 43136]|uniref:alpha/beta hydrolase n=1 Tax=Vibrio sp. SCSIO 43136 TaxID=2819101 RepID=UPI002074E05C|nr:alpha/beta hydrolase [Vibrio sp. SCSIO 43136]USD67087.1 alpha/beta hydrolase [Vibrio sp. SCSIO 43136]
MKVLDRSRILVSLIAATLSFQSFAAPYVVEKDITFKTIGDKSIQLDLYRPSTASEQPYPLLIWVHGGAWKRGTKNDIPTKNPLLLNSMLKQGYALAAVDYRLSGEVNFPKPVQDINDAINYLAINAEHYNINADKVVMMGRSAGGHLASLIGATNSHNVSFYDVPKYQVVGVVSFFGPSDLLALGNKGAKKASKKSSVSRFLGDIPANIPEIAKQASPSHYVNSKTPPYVMLHGDLDKPVPLSQSKLLKKLLDSAEVENQLFIEQGVGHSAPIFDTDKYVPEVVKFVQKQLPNRH